MNFYDLILTIILSAAAAAAHGWISEITLNNELFLGYNPTTAPWAPDQGTIAWPSWNTDTGPVYSSNVSSPDIICQKNATNAKKIGTVAAGSDILLKWTKWPDSHHGPVFAYLADCHGDCVTANKTDLEWFKIAQAGRISLGAGGGTPGTWAADQLRENGSWSVHIPASIKAGDYVVRHEILALHSAYEVGAAQFYPSCFNVRIVGSGTDSPLGIVGQRLYSDTDPGVHFNIYNDETNPIYQMPGPPLYQASVNPQRE
ncbi:glycoside hydrolase [Thozetella sp. PMI_491]|nr:glycoside hydrolase [Thozetella sp. PMI_491]